MARLGIAPDVVDEHIGSACSQEQGMRAPKAGIAARPCHDGGPSFEAQLLHEILPSKPPSWIRPAERQLCAFPEIGKVSQSSVSSGTSAPRTPSLVSPGADIGEGPRDGAGHR